VRFRLSLGLGAAVLLGAGLRLHGLTRHSLWLDEANSVAIAGRDPGEIAAALVHDSSPPLYYVLLHGWMALFGDGEGSVRHLSVLLGVLLVPATALLALRLGGRRAAVAAAFLAAATPMAVQFSQEARMYALLPLLAALAAERLLVYLAGGGRGALLAHALLLAAVCYTHNWGLLLLPAAGAAVLIHPQERWRDWALAALAVLILYAPWAPALRAQASGSSYLFIEKVQEAPAWELPFRSLALFAAGVGTTGGEARGLLPAAGTWLASAVWVLLLWASLRDAATRRWNLAALLLAAVPLAAAAIGSAAWRPVYLLGRYEIMVLPILLALVAGGASGLLRGRLLPIAMALWAAGLALLSLGYTGEPQRRFPEREMAQRLAPRLGRGDRVVFCGLYRAAMEYYLRREGASFTPASFPPDAAGHLGWHQDEAYDPGDPALIAAARGHCPPAGERTWVVMTGGRACRRLFDELSGCARLTSPFAALGVPFDQMVMAEP
jgi:uncharacterized membrane protein